MATRINIPKWLDKYNRWQIKVRKDGERKTFTCPIPGRKGKIECQRKADAWLEDDVISGDSKVSKLYKQWMEELKVAGGTSHYKQYKSFGDVYIIKKIGNKKTGAVTTQDLQGIILYAYASGNKGKGLSHKTLRGLRSCIIAFIKYARKSKASTLHPEGLYIPKGAKKSKKNILQPNDIAILFSRDTTTSHRKEVPEWYIYAFRFAVVTGLRPGELLGMKRSDITKDVCMIRRSINSHNEITDGKNDNAERSFVLTNTAKQILRDQRKMLSKNSVVSPYIFPAPDGNHAMQQTHYKHWKAFRALWGISNVTPYELRHTFVSLNKNIPKEMFRQIVGHSKDMDTFGVYGHEVDGEKYVLAKMIEGNVSKYIKGVKGGVNKQ